MEFKKVKQAFKIQDAVFVDVMRIKALLKILKERYDEDYPVNYLSTITLKTEKSAEEALDKCYHILRDIVQH